MVMKVVNVVNVRAPRACEEFRSPSKNISRTVGFRTLGMVIFNAPVKMTIENLTGYPGSISIFRYLLQMVSSDRVSLTIEKYLENGWFLGVGNGFIQFPSENDHKKTVFVRYWRKI